MDRVDEDPDPYGIPRPETPRERRRAPLVGIQTLLFLEKLVVVPAFVFYALDASRGLPFLALWPTLLVLAFGSLAAMAAHGTIALGLFRRASWAWDTAWTGGWGLLIFDGMLAFAATGVTGEPLAGVALLIVVLLDAYTLWQVRDADVARHHHRASPTRRY